MLLVEKTIKEFGYNPNIYENHSKNSVWVKCDYCPKEFTKTLSNRKHHLLKSKDGKDHCRICQAKLFSKSYGTLEDRFWRKVNKKSENECWEWLGTKDPDGYGHIYIKKNGKVKRTIVSRLSYEIYHNVKMETNKVAAHTCDNPSCVNPLHIFSASNIENQKDKINKNRQCRGEKINTNKLTESQVLEIRKLHLDNPKLEQQDIADLYNVTQVNISAILRRKTWKHI